MKTAKPVPPSDNYIKDIFNIHSLQQTLCLEDVKCEVSVSQMFSDLPVENHLPGDNEADINSPQTPF